jgi:hypothetical protein
MLLLLLRAIREGKGFIWPEKRLFKADYKRKYRKCYKRVYT